MSRSKMAEVEEWLHIRNGEGLVRETERRKLTPRLVKMGWILVNGS
jgi:hypothetical protein